MNDTGQGPERDCLVSQDSIDDKTTDPEYIYILIVLYNNNLINIIFY